MYNRYTPQADGSWQKSQRQEPSPPPRPQPRRPARQEPDQDGCPQQEPEECREPESAHQDFPVSPCHPDGSVGGFLRRLIPKDFDTGDLLVILLLLLIAGDNSEDRSSALLTLALYFFM